MSTTHNTQEKFMLKTTIEQVKSMFRFFDKPQTYGSALEAYIVAGNPQDACDIDRLQRQFDLNQAKRTNSGWIL